jgi:hypothetical protein
MGTKNITRDTLPKYTYAGGGLHVISFCRGVTVLFLQTQSPITSLVMKAILPLSLVVALVATAEVLPPQRVYPRLLPLARLSQPPLGLSQLLLRPGRHPRLIFQNLLQLRCLQLQLFLSSHHREQRLLQLGAEDGNRDVLARLPSKDRALKQSLRQNLRTDSVKLRDRLLKSSDETFRQEKIVQHSRRRSPLRFG